MQNLISNFLSQPGNWYEVDFKKILWLHGNAMRSRLARHDAVVNDPDPHYDRLAPAVADAFRLPVEIWNVLAIGDSTLATLDSSRLGPQEAEKIEKEIHTAKPVVDAAIANRKVTTIETEALIELEREIVAHAADDINGRQAKLVSNETNKNLIGRAVAGAYKTAYDLSDPDSEETKLAVKEFKSGFYKAAGAGMAAVAATGVTAAGVAAYIHGWEFMEFVATNSIFLKQYFSLVYANPKLDVVVDHIVSVRNWLILKEFQHRKPLS